MAFLVGLVAIGAAWWWLWHLKQRDLAECRAVLGLEPVASGETTRGTTPEGFAFSQTALLRGVLLGRPATLWARTVRHPAGAKYRRRGSQFTVLELGLDAPVRCPLRVQPAGLLTGLEAVMHGPAADRVPIDEAFDASYVVYAPRAAEARLLFTAERCQQLLAFRASVGGTPAATMPGRLASGLLLGTFEIDGAAARYVLFGSPMKATAQHVNIAAPVLLDLAAAAGA